MVGFCLGGYKRGVSWRFGKAKGHIDNNSLAWPALIEYIPHLCIDSSAFTNWLCRRMYAEGHQVAVSNSPLLLKSRNAIIKTCERLKIDEILSHLLSCFGSWHEELVPYLVPPRPLQHHPSSTQKRDVQKRNGSPQHHRRYPHLYASSIFILHLWMRLRNRVSDCSLLINLPTFLFSGLIIILVWLTLATT